MRRVLPLLLLLGCSQRPEAPSPTSSAALAASSAPGSSPSLASASLASPLSSTAPQAAAPATASTAAASTAAASAGPPAAASAAAVVPASVTTAPGACPEGMTRVEGGLFWMGHSDGGVPEEAPRHHVALRSFCMDRTEVTTGAYRRCLEQGACTAPHGGSFCNGTRTDRDDHPINCVDWNQAVAFCKNLGRRLPTEREWEYAARNGPEQRTYAWGSEPPDGRCCYDHPGTCAVGSYAPGPFGLLDLTGNVWEWTSSAFGPYPDELLEGPTRVYRGGSFSRRFPKWMRNGLRNRYRAEEQGAHLGLRCALDLPGTACPPGSHELDGRCHADDAPPPAPQRPAPPGSAPTPAASHAPAEPVSTRRDARFDDDCARHKPGRPLAYLVSGGTFADRQRAKGACVNRDVGVGFNSVCCAH